MPLNHSKSPKHVAPEATAYERILLTEGDRVDVYVGSAKKNYRLPKKFLCEHSSYFDRCFNGHFVEAQTQSLYLDEDRVDFWEAILDFMYYGKVEMCKLSSIRGDDEVEDIRLCMAYIMYTDKYELPGATIAVYTALRASYIGLSSYCLLSIGIEEQVELIFRATPPNSKLRELIVQVVLGCRRTFGEFCIPQEEHVSGFAAELLRQMRRNDKREALDPNFGGYLESDTDVRGTGNKIIFDDWEAWYNGGRALVF